MAPSDDIQRTRTITTFYTLTELFSFGNFSGEIVSGRYIENIRDIFAKIDANVKYDQFICRDQAFLLHLPAPL